MEITLRKKEDFHEKHLVLGTAGLGGAWGPVDLNKSVETLQYALKNGINVLDTAPSYKDAETMVGRAIKDLREKDRPIISTKTGRLRGEYADDTYYDYSPKGMEKSVQNSLKILGVEAIDILFLHDPQVIPDGDIEEVVETMKSFKRKGYTKEIGLGGNFDNELYYDYLNEDCFTVFQGYNRFNALTLIAAKEEFAHCKNKGVMIYASSPLFMGLLGRKLVGYLENWPEWIDTTFREKALRCKNLAEEHNMSLPDLAHRFLFSCAGLDRVVMGASKQYQVENTLQVWKQGPLEENLFNQILQFSKNNV